MCYAVCVMCRRAQWPRLALAAALFATLAAPALAQQSDVDPLAVKLAGKLKTGPTRVIVAGFLDSRDLRSPLGAQLAGEFADALYRSSPGMEFISREEFNRVRREGLWTEDDARGFSVLRTLALDLGARLLITGWYERRKESLRLTVQAFDFRKDRRVAEVSATLPLTEARIRLDEQPFGLRRREKDPEPSALSTEVPAAVYLPGKDGVGFPVCVRCQDPSFTPEARAAKYAGRVMLKITVTTEGKPANIRVEKGAQYGLTEAALKAVRQWRFKPAKDKTGQPVPVEVMIEVTFRLL